MSAYGMKQLVAHLIDEDSLDIMVIEAPDMGIVPDGEVRAVVQFAIDYYITSGREVAPTVEVFDSHEVSAGRTIGNLLDDKEIPWREGAETSIEWCLEDLKSSFITSQAQKLFRDASTAMAETDAEDRLNVFSDAVSEAVSLVLMLQDRRTRVNMPEAIRGRLEAYEERLKVGGADAGMSLALPEIDLHTGLVQPGELAMFAAFAKVGKSLMLNRMALANWEQGKNVVLFTLENSIEMTLDRMACMSTGVDPSRWQRGECHDVEVKRVTEMIERIEHSENPLHIISPEPGQRTPHAMVRLAQVLGADGIIIDQLSHMEHPNPRKGIRSDEIWTEIMRDLRLLVSTGRHKMSALVAHQINREGKKAADKRGYHEMTDLAETSGAERETDLVLSGYQSHDMAQVHQMLVQTLAARRVDIKWWDMQWNIGLGLASIRGERVPFSE